MSRIVRGQKNREPKYRHFKSLYERDSEVEWCYSSVNSMLNLQTIIQINNKLMRTIKNTVRIGSLENYKFIKNYNLTTLL